MRPLLSAIQTASLARALIGWGLLIWAAAGLRPAAAQTAGPRVLEQPAPAYTFGGPVTFEITAAAAAEIADLTLFVRTPDEPRTFVGKARFTRGLEAAAEYTLEPERRRLLPFSPVTYWWEITDGAGRLLATDPQTFVYTDNRFDWQTRAAGPLTVAWYAGGTAFGQAVLDAARDGLERANRDLQAPLPETVWVYVYANAGDAAEALRPADRAWADAHAAPVFGTVAVILDPADVNTPARLTREIPHELTHILVARRAGAQFANVPAWLNEGLAKFHEAEPDPDAAPQLAAAAEAGRLPALAALCAPFPADAAQAQLAYLESESVVRYLRERHGAASLNQLLDAYADGLDCEAGVQRVLGLSLADLQQQWQAAKLQANPASLPLRLLGPWLVLGLMVLAGPGLVWALTRRPKPAGRVL